MLYFKSIQEYTLIHTSWVYKSIPWYILQEYTRVYLDTYFRSIQEYTLIHTSGVYKSIPWNILQEYTRVDPDTYFRTIQENIIEIDSYFRGIKVVPKKTELYTALQKKIFQTFFTLCSPREAGRNLFLFWTIFNGQH